MKRLMTLCMLMGMFVCAVYAQKKITGQCGIKITYTIDLDAKKLTLKGGKGSTYINYLEDMPWSQYSDDITTLEILGDINDINWHIIKNLTALEGFEVGKTDAYFTNGNCLFTSDSVLCMVCYANPVIPEWTKGIGSYVFCQNTSLSEITIPSGVTSIGEGAFFGCISLSSIEIPASVQTIGKSAFAECTTLTKAIVAANTVGQQAFRGCSALSELTLQPSVEKIGVGAFYDCRALRKIDIPSSVTSIYDGAFAGCTALSQISIPSELTYMGISCFDRCISLPLDNHVRYADKWAVDLDNTNRESYVVREGTEGIAGGLFAGCKRMTSVSIPSGVRFLGNNVFVKSSSLLEINIADSIPVVSKEAFNGVNCLSVKTSVYDKTYLLAHGAVESKAIPIATQNGAVAPKTSRNGTQPRYTATFPGGNAELARFLVKNLSCKEAIPSDTCIFINVWFDVADDGTISNVKTDSIAPSTLKDELLRVVNLMPKWKIEADKRGKPHIGSFCVAFPYNDESDVLAEYKNASFPGGEEACMMWLARNMRYPSICQEQGIQGRVIVSFIVHVDGTLSDIRIQRSPDDYLSEEAIRVVKSMPKWNPATISSKTVTKKVRSRFNLPIMFRMG